MAGDDGRWPVPAVVAVAVLGRRRSPVFVDRVVYARPDAAVTAPPLPMADATSVLRFRERVLNDPTLASVPITGGRGRPPGPTGLDRLSDCLGPDPSAPSLKPGRIHATPAAHASSRWPSPWP